MAAFRVSNGALCLPALNCTASALQCGSVGSRIIPSGYIQCCIAEDVYISSASVFHFTGPVLISSNLDDKVIAHLHEPVIGGPAEEKL